MANRVRITLTGEGGDAEQALRGVERRMERVDRQAQETSRGMRGLNRVSGNMTSAMQGLAGAAGIAAGAAGMGYLVNQSLTAQEELLNLHKTTGVNIQRLQEYQFAARKSGVAQGQFNEAISEMSQRMGEALADFERTGKITEMGEGFQAAGISMRELQQLNPTQTFDRLATAIQEAESEQAALNIAAKSFGDEQGRAMVTMFREGEGAINSYIERAHELGIILDEDVVRQSVEAKKKITTLTVALESQFNRVVGNLAPAISEVSDDMADWLENNQKFLEQDLPQDIRDVANAATVAAREIGVLAESIGFVLSLPAKAGRGAARAIYGSAESTQRIINDYEDLEARLARVKRAMGNLDESHPQYEQYASQAKELRSEMELLESTMERQAEPEYAIQGMDMWLQMAGSIERAKEQTEQSTQATEQDTQATRENNKAKEEQLSNLERINQQLRTHEDVLQAQRAQAMAPSGIGPGSMGGADDDLVQEQMRQAERTRQMAAGRGIQGSIIPGDAVDDQEMIDKLDKVEEEGKSTAQTLENAFDGWANRFSGQLTDMVWEAEFSFDKILTSFGKMITQMIIQQQMVNLFGAGQSGWGAIGQGASALFSAQGNVFSGGHHLQQYAQGGVVNKPTVFPMANGAGVMGEDGPEAVMPLRRTRGGDLGVQAQGGGAPSVEVNVINRSGEPVDARQDEPKFDGRKYILNVVLDAANRNQNGFGKNLKGALSKA